MKQTMNKWMPAAILTVCGMMLLSGCKHDANDYVKKTYSMTDEERIAHAEQTLGTTIDRQHDWALTTQYSVKITADADLENISEVAVLDDDPYAGSTYRLAAAAVANGGSATLTFRAPKDAEVLYAVCYNASGLCIARPFQPGIDTQVSLREVLTAGSEASASAPNRAFSLHRATTGPLEPDAGKFYLANYPSFLRAVRNVLPEGQDNRAVIGSHDYTNTIQVRLNPFTIYDLPIAFIGGDSQTDVHLLYTWYPVGDENYQESFLINDSYDGTGTVAVKDLATKQYMVNGHYLQCRQAERNIGRGFTAGDKLVLQLAKGEELMADADQRVKVFMLNGYVFIACEDGNDWDYNDRLYWMPQGAERIEKATTAPITPEPAKPQLWTYAWEDKDKGDYDMNDCVIEVQENADDKTKIDVSLVALGGTRNLWLGFDNKNAKRYDDYIPVFSEELHKVLGIPVGQMANTGNGTRTVDAVTVTVSKPAGFDFQTCSFILGAKFKEDEQGIYESDYYAIKIATKGQDPHGIIIPGKWQWPMERTCIKDAYTEFNTWASDRTKCQDWYRHSQTGKVVNR
jgi:hypothetical protein